jgi:predicted helicase
MPISAYLSQVTKRHNSGIAREHAYRADLEKLLRAFVPTEHEVTNEPANVTQCGNPDFVITKNQIAVGFIEAKDIGSDLDSNNYKEQFDRYKNALDNLIITDYLEFRFYQKGQLVQKIAIATLEHRQIIPQPQNFALFEQYIADFCTYTSQTIKSAATLAKLMAGKARLLEAILEKAVTSDEESEANTELNNLMNAFKAMLIHDLTPQAFADLYAQTLAYGMFAARLHDTTPDTFSRQEAATLIPQTNPFLRRLFGLIAGIDIDPRLKTTVDNLADVFRAADVKQIIASIGQSSSQNDPIIHFYETFLSEYNPALRKSRGVWYTPKPVVSFMVRAVDDILKQHFNLAEGLADTSKTTIDMTERVAKIKNKKTIFTDEKVKKEVHKVQLLDPATGTGTFLAEVIRYIHQNNFEGMQGVWNNYVEQDLIPRLNGFELLMASYAVAHLKLDLLLTETGYVPQNINSNQRFRVFLTNSLEEHHPDTGTLFATWLSNEAQEANYIKRDTPVMVVLGNPPYSVSSSNKSEWIEELMKDYKKDLNERNIQPLSDDYIKFIRYGQHFVDRNGSGILAYISNNSFIDGVIHRKMRQSLLESFDSIYIVDLHGSSKKKETALDGSKDDNVFDIMQGVAISFFVKTGNKKKGELAQVFQYDLKGKRENKYQFLAQNTLDAIQWQKLTLKAPEYFLMPQNLDVFAKYDKGFKINELFTINSTGVKTHRDDFVIDIDKSTLVKRIQDFYNPEIIDDAIRTQYELKDNRDWSLVSARKNSIFNDNYILYIDYRPFDKRAIYFDTNLIDFSREQVMKNFIVDNLGLCFNRQIEQQRPFTDVFIVQNIITNHSVSLKENNTIAPLYIYPTAQDLLSTDERQPNFNADIIKTIAKKLKLTFTPEKETTTGSFAPIDVLDYIYAVLHSPNYRNTYKEFLKTDFPRVPYPKNADNFWQLVNVGGQIRQLHLLQSDSLKQSPVTYPQAGNNSITRKIVQKDWQLLAESSTVGRIYINDQQYFDNIPLIAWEFYIGGYQPAQKWLKDRTGRQLTTADIQHYRKMVKALLETARLMQDIDTLLVL